jgi:serralysin
MSTLPTYVNDQIAEQIGEGYYGADLRWNLDSTGPHAQAGVITYDLSALSPARAALARQALGLYEAVLDIDFRPVAGAADIRFADRGNSANTRLLPDGDTITGAVINIAARWDGGGSTTGDYVFQTFLHEIGHALGLGHPGPYNETGTYVTDTNDPDYGDNSNIFLNDSWQVSVMSYFSQSDNTSIKADHAYLISPMVADWIALDAKYDLGGFTGNTTWGFNSTVPGTLYAHLARFADKTAFTIVDTGGNDTVDFSGYGADQRINLTAASYSDIGGLKGNMAISRGSLIENAVGGAGSDTLLGNAEANGLRGGAGNDDLQGGAGADRLHGGIGTDRLAGGVGADELIGFAGRDVLIGGGGRDTFVFGATSESVGRTSDVIRPGGGAPAFEGAGAAPGDLIDLSGIDANTVRPGEQSFVFGEPGRGHVWCVESGSRTVVYADTGGGSLPEFRLDILDGDVRAADYTVDDFIL